MKKKICFITGTRADFGIMAPIMRQISRYDDLQLQIVATNMHLSPLYGNTVEEIEAQGFKVDAKIPSLVEGGSQAATVKSMAILQDKLADELQRLQPDYIMILGDRYEALAAASTAVVFNIPVIHLHGGETTEGAIDNRFRHAITQLSQYHFASTPEYTQKIISMGADPSNVFHAGAPGAEVSEGDPSEELLVAFVEKTGIQPYEPFILLAFHPVTLAADNGLEELNATLEALDSFIRKEGLKVLVTLPNSDPGSIQILERLKEWQLQHANSDGAVVMVESLGAKLFHYALEMALAIVGNSSAALIEAPSHRLGAVNVGNRQKGRTHGITVIDAPAQKSRIEEALKAVTSMEMKSILLGMPVSSLNPYYKENASEFISKQIHNIANKQL